MFHKSTITNKFKSSQETDSFTVDATKKNLEFEPSHIKLERGGL